MRLVLTQPQLEHGPSASNLERIVRLLDGAALELTAEDILLLPEHFHFGTERAAYEADVIDLAGRLGCHVIGGSHHEQRPVGNVNSGVIADPAGNIVGRYEKLRPYAAERQWVSPGSVLGEVSVAGCNVLVLVCADFWFSDLWPRATRLPDLVCVPALSVTRKPAPDYSRSLWRHLAIARAYEFGTYVGISDWAHPSALPLSFASGVGGFADPTPHDEARMFTPIGDTGVTTVSVDLPALEAFRRDRMERGFFWKRD
jgi:predicted amidohydrolase